MNKSATLTALVGLSVFINFPVFAVNPEWTQATSLYSAGNYAAALSAFSKLSDKSPRDASIHYMLGQCYKGLSKTKQATLEFDWVSKYAPDQKTKAMAAGMLARMGAPVEMSSNLATRAGTTASGSSLPAPPSDFINDSASQTIAAAGRIGWIPCRGKCLNFATPGWHHEHMEGHADTDMWMSYPNSVSTYNYSQRHVGHIIQEHPDKNAVDVGPCSQCHGTGWIRRG